MPGFLLIGGWLVNSESIEYIKGRGQGPESELRSFKKDVATDDDKTYEVHLKSGPVVIISVSEFDLIQELYTIYKVKE